MWFQQAGAGVAGPAPSAAAKPAEFRDSTTLTKALKILRWVSVALGLVSIVSSLFELKLLNDLQGGLTLAPGEAESNDLRQQIIAIVRFPLLVTTIIVFAVWIHRANRNARALGAVGMRFSPGWAVGWFFVPIANLWKPYQAMKEIWQA